MTLSAGRYHSFVVRVWTRQEGGEVVYGRITHVGSRETRTFRTEKEMLAFLNAHLASAAPCLHPSSSVEES